MKTKCERSIELTSKGKKRKKINKGGRDYFHSRLLEGSYMGRSDQKLENLNFSSVTIYAPASFNYAGFPFGVPVLIFQYFIL